MVPRMNPINCTTCKVIYATCTGHVSRGPQDIRDCASHKGDYLTLGSPSYFRPQTRRIKFCGLKWLHGLGSGHEMVEWLCSLPSAIRKYLDNSLMQSFANNHVHVYMYTRRLHHDHIVQSPYVMLPASEHEQEHIQSCQFKNLMVTLIRDSFKNYIQFPKLISRDQSQSREHGFSY